MPWYVINHFKFINLISLPQKAYPPTTTNLLVISNFYKIVDLVVLSIRSLRKRRLENKFDNSEAAYSNSAIENDNSGKQVDRNDMKLPIVRETSVETLAIIVA